MDRRIDRKALKAKAKEYAFKNKWNYWKPFLALFVITFLVGFVSGIFGDSFLGSIVSLVGTIVLLPVEIGVISYTIKLTRQQNPDLKEELTGKFDMIKVILLTVLVVGLATLGWTLLLIIPGIIYAYKVIMTTFILADTANKDTRWQDVISDSKKMMDGYKLDYFVFQLSFLLWIYGGLFTLGILWIWAVPYMQAATVMYYDELKRIQSANLTV